MSARVAALGGQARRWWPRLRTPLAVGFFLLVAGLLAWQATTVEWREVGAAMTRIGAPALAAAAGLAMVSYGIYACFDLLGRRLTGHELATRKVLTVSLVSYAFNLNFGALIGGMGFRYRLYSRFGLSAGVITRVLAFSVITNWLGYLALAGVMLATGVVTLPESWVGHGALRAVGVALVLVFLGYMALAVFGKRRELTVRGHVVPMPSRRMAFVQAGLSAANWMTMAVLIAVLLPGDDIAYPVVLGTLLLAAIAGVVSHVPAGLGVLEAVFVAVIGSQVPRNELLAALLAYRTIYYLAPLAVAGVVYFLTEAGTRRR